MIPLSLVRDTPEEVFERANKIPYAAARIWHVTGAAMNCARMTLRHCLSRRFAVVHSLFGTEKQAEKNNHSSKFPE